MQSQALALLSLHLFYMTRNKLEIWCGLVLVKEHTHGVQGLLLTLRIQLGHMLKEGPYPLTHISDPRKDLLLLCYREEEEMETRR